MKDPNDLIAGFRRFRDKYLGAGPEFFQRLASGGQAPKVMIIACCDSRVDPAIVLDCNPGDLFVVRNVANLVPPCEEGGGYHGTSAALEFAVSCLHVEHIIVMGHAQCGGIRALLGDNFGCDTEASFIAPWMSIVAAARQQVANSSADIDSKAAACETAAIGISLENLKSFPFVRDAVTRGTLALHGWYFDIERGELLAYEVAEKRFQPLVGVPDALDDATDRSALA